MQKTRFWGEISLVTLSHHKIYVFSGITLGCGKISPVLAPEKNLSAPPVQIVSLNVVFLLFINIFVGWDALAKTRRGKEKNRSKKRTLPDRHLGS